MEIVEFIRELNGDLAREYSAAIQYTQHAATLTGLHFAFVGELYTHAAEEQGHAKVLNEHINFLRGIPLTAVAPIFTATNPLVMFHQDLTGELEAIARYKLRIKQAEELGLIGTVAILLDILADEESHANDLQSILEA
jgi:bacterioferritin